MQTSPDQIPRAVVVTQSPEGRVEEVLDLKEIQNLLMGALVMYYINLDSKGASLEVRRKVHLLRALWRPSMES